MTLQMAYQNAYASLGPDLSEDAEFDLSCLFEHIFGAPRPATARVKPTAQSLRRSMRLLPGTRRASRCNICLACGNFTACRSKSDRVC